MPLRKKRGPLTPPRHRAASCRPLGDSTSAIIATEGRRGRPGRGHGVADDQNECEQSYKHESFHWKAVSLYLHSKSRHRIGGTGQEMGREAPCTDVHVWYEAHHYFRRVTCNRELLLRGADLLPGGWSWAQGREAPLSIRLLGQSSKSRIGCYPSSSGLHGS